MKTGVVLINWNGGEFTLPCIASLKAAAPAPWAILVVDNGSTDGSADEIAALHPDVILIRSRENLGFAAGNNRGIRELLARGADAVWILNNDTEVHHSCLSRLESLLVRNPSAEAVSGKIRYLSDPETLWYAGGDLLTASMSARHRGMDRIDRGQFDTECAVGFLSGCCMLIRREAFSGVGLFDEQYFIYHEDVEWCFRARARGAELWYEPRALLFHNVSATVRKNTLGRGGGRVSARAHYLETRNRLFTARLHCRGGAALALAVALNLWRAARLVPALTLRGRFDKARAVLKGFREGLTRKLAPAARMAPAAASSEITPS